MITRVKSVESCITSICAEPAILLAFVLMRIASHLWYDGFENNAIEIGRSCRT